MSIYDLLLLNDFIIVIIEDIENKKKKRYAWEIKIPRIIFWLSIFSLIFYTD